MGTRHLLESAHRCALVRERGEANPLRQLIVDDEVLGPLLAKLPAWQAERFVGRAPEQTIEYLDEVVAQLPTPAEDGETELSV